MKNFTKRILTKLKNDEETENIRIVGDFLPIGDTTEQDVFIVGYPKSGNTLMQHIIATLIYGLNEDANRTMINMIVPDIYSNSHYLRLSDTCYFKSHNLPSANYRKVIYIVRDGRAALNSYYHMARKMGQNIQYEALYNDKIKLFGATWAEHILAWEKNPYNADILWLRYEDILTEKLGALRKICDFLGIIRCNESLSNVKVLTSLEHMKTLQNRSDWKKINQKYFLNNDQFIRSGKKDSFINEVDKQLIANFESNNLSMLKKYGYHE